MKPKRILFNADAMYELTTNEGKPATLVGYALVWNVLSSDRGGYFVRFAPGSANFLTPTFALFNHDYANPLARNDDTTLRIMSDDYGVRVEIDLPDTNLGRDLEVLVGRRTIRGMSFAMVPGGTSETTTENGIDIVTFTQFDADEVTITAIPAFDQTTIDVQQDDQTILLLEKSSKDLHEQYCNLMKYKLDSYRF